MSEGVDAGVGAAGALREHGFAGDLVERGGEGALHGGQIRLDLPAVEWRSVIGEDEFPELHGESLQNITCVDKMRLRAILRDEQLERQEQDSLWE